MQLDKRYSLCDLVFENSLGLIKALPSSTTLVN